MSLWLCRAGRFGERESEALDMSRAVIGWEEVSSLAQIQSRDDVTNLLQTTYPDAKQNTLLNWRNQLWAFSKSMQRGDLVVLPLKTRPAIAFGRITGDYTFDAAGTLVKHFRPVEWLVRDVPRTRFPKDLLFSFGAAQTVCRITRHDAEQRVVAFLKGGEATNWDDRVEVNAALRPDEPTDISDPVLIDIQDYADDQVRRFIQANFAGHELARLVEAILVAKGYRTLNSKPGRDGGVDILAGLGELGFEAPRICVQVKSEDASLDVSVLRELQATISNFGAEHGLLVGWGGFKQSLISEAKRLFFKIRLWDSADLLTNLFAVYDKLDADIKAKLPLKPVWTVVQGAADEQE